MSQSKISSLAETLTSIAIGFIVSLLLTAYVFPAYGHHVTFSQNVQITAIFTVASIARGYVIRRIFNYWGKK